MEGVVSLAHARRAALAALLVPAALVAQSNGSSGMSEAADPGPSGPPIVNARLIAGMHPIKWVYALALQTGGTPERVGFRTLQVSSATFRGRPAWLVVDSRQMHELVQAESVYVAKADLAPLHRVEHTATGRSVTEFTRDSIRTTFDDDSAGHAVVSTRNEPGVIPTMEVLEALLGMSPLSADWSASARLAAIGRDGGGIVPVSTRTTGAEQVAIPDGAFDAWLVVLRVGKGEERIWVRKSDGVVVKEEIPVIGMPGARLEQLLALGGAKSAD